MSSSPSSPPSPGGFSKQPSTESEATPPPSPPPPPPPPFVCDDFVHCRGGPTNVLCHQNNNVWQCPGLGQAGGITPPSVSGAIHPVPTPVTVCANCIGHQGNNPIVNVAPGQDNSSLIDGFAFQSMHTPRFRAQLCHDCIRDEVILYWERQGTPRPIGQPSMLLTASWPTVPGSVQNLCICQEKSIVAFHRHCHECRMAAFAQFAADDKAHAAEILGTRTRPVITGKKLCDLNGGIERHAISETTQDSRVRRRVGRQCPCGATPKPREEEEWEEYITYCLACMGVQIDPDALPEKYQQANVRPKRRSARLAGNVTKGPRRAPVSSSFRVNIERGWLPNDLFVGGTH